MTKKNILILGADGMVGKTVYKYFKHQKEFSTLGTSRKNAKLCYLEVKSFKNDLEKIMQKHSLITAVINCIGETSKTPEIKNLIKINSLFPQELAEFLNNNKVKLIHISTDAVFGRKQNNASEITNPLPDTLYGSSKLLGEPSLPNCITIRTSILGLSNLHSRGLLDWARTQKADLLEGYSNHLWSGSTSFQLGLFCHYLINAWARVKMSQARIIHFSPIKPVSKYEILKAAKAVGIIDKEILKRKDAITVNRTLVSSYFDKKPKSKYTCKISEALSELLDFHKIHG